VGTLLVSEFYEQNCLSPLSACGTAAAFRVREAIGFAERLFMKLIKGSVAGLALAGILALLPAAAFARGGGVGHLGRGGLASGHDGRFHRHESGFVGFGLPDPYYPYADEGYPYVEPYSGDGSGPADAAVYPNDLGLPVQSDLARRGDYHSPTDSVLSPASSQPQGSGRGPHDARSSNGPVIAGEPQKPFRPEPNKPAAPGADPPGANASTLVTAATVAPHGHVLDKLVLVSWLKDAGKDTILVENTETGDVQQITSQPNKDHFRIVEMHVNADPRLTEVVISNGAEQGSVKFRFETPATANSPESNQP
jgi:hypothetical protein